MEIRSHRSVGCGGELVCWGTLPIAGALAGGRIILICLSNTGGSCGGGGGGVLSCDVGAGDSITAVGGGSSCSSEKEKLESCSRASIVITPQFLAEQIQPHLSVLLALKKSQVPFFYEITLSIICNIAFTFILDKVTYLVDPPQECIIRSRMFIWVYATCGLVTSGQRIQRVVVFRQHVLWSSCWYNVVAMMDGVILLFFRFRMLKWVVPILIPLQKHDFPILEELVFSLPSLLFPHYPFSKSNVVLYQLPVAVDQPHFVMPNSQLRWFKWTMTSWRVCKETLLLPSW